MKIDWTRAPGNPRESALVRKHHEAALVFLRGFRDPNVTDRYKGDENAQRLLRVQTPIILGACDAFEAEETLSFGQSSVPAQLEQRLGADWGYISNALHALASVDVIGFAPNCTRDHYELQISSRVANDQKRAATANSLNYSRPLDVHTWSEHPEVNTFVDDIYDKHFEAGGGNLRIRKKHLKVLLLDLYVAWCDDPNLKIALQRDHNAYRAKSRYNSLHISSMMPQIADRLINVGLLHEHEGFHDPRTGIGRSSRIWPTKGLIQKFEDARFGLLDIGRHEDRECIILRDIDETTEKTVDIEYEDTIDTVRMREELKAYNELLSRAYVDIPTLETNYIDLGFDTEGNPVHLFINQRDKFVRRIFNRGSWDKGGRFWGGWWQRCPKDWRRFAPGKGQPGIFINDKPTVEIDYSGMHMVMLYGQSGIDYWTEVRSENPDLEDPYTVKLPETFGFTQDQLRSICKLLVLMALNAKDESATFKAFRADADTGSPEKSLKDNQLRLILDALKKKHEPIAHKFATDQGIDLMRQDSEITARIINHFTSQSIPILTIHDSYIVNDGSEYQLDKAMKEAFEDVTGVAGVKLKAESLASGDIVEKHFEMENEKPSQNDPDLRSSLNLALTERLNPARSERYKSHLSQFEELQTKSDELQVG